MTRSAEAEITVACLQFEPVITRLYNEMHYGRTETLTAITSLSLLIPWLAAALAFGLWTAVRYVRSADRMAKSSDGRS